MVELTPNGLRIVLAYPSILAWRLPGIADDYFSTPPPLVREEDYRDADHYLRQVAGCPELNDPWDREVC
jgi:hypothetical protein